MSRPLKLDIPMLQAPEDTDLSTFTDWRTCWVDYIALTRVMDDEGSPGSPPLPEWTILWQTGRLGIALNDDIDGIVEKLGRYLRLRRNPLLDRKDFFNRNQEDGENIDQYVSALVRIHNRCGFDEEEEDRCLQCVHSWGHTNRLRERRIRDRLIVDLRDSSMQRRVLLEDFRKT